MGQNTVNKEKEKKKVEQRHKIKQHRQHKQNTSTGMQERLRIKQKDDSKARKSE